MGNGFPATTLALLPYIRTPGEVRPGTCVSIGSMWSAGLRLGSASPQPRPGDRRTSAYLSIQCHFPPCVSFLVHGYSRFPPPRAVIMVGLDRCAIRLTARAQPQLLSNFLSGFEGFSYRSVPHVPYAITSPHIRYPLFIFPPLWSIL